MRDNIVLFVQALIVSIQLRPPLENDIERVESPFDLRTDWI